MLNNARLLLLSANALASHVAEFKEYTCKSLLSATVIKFSTPQPVGYF